MALEILKPQPGECAARHLGRMAMGAVMVVAGISHLTFARKPFRAQVPRFVPRMVPLSVDQVVVYSGAAEISLGASMLLLPQHRKQVGWVLAAFYVAIFPGNVAQWMHHRSAFGLDTDAKRFLRLFFQPALVGWALWSTGALKQERRPALHLTD